MTVEYLRQRTVVSHSLLTREAKALEMLNALYILIKSTQVHKMNLCFRTLHVNVLLLYVTPTVFPRVSSQDTVTYLKGNYIHKCTTE